MKHLCQCKTIANLETSNPNLYVAECPNCGKYYIYPQNVNSPIECEAEEVIEVPRTRGRKAERNVPEV